jgi:mannosyltransferase OCH1-like enzyme
MIPKNIHQIFWDFSHTGKTLNDFHVFQDCHFVVEQRAKEYGYDLKLWNYSDCLNLIKEHYPEYAELWIEFPQDVMRCDFVRYLILHRYGGIYLDMDMFPMKDFSELLDHKQVFARWNNEKHLKPYIALMMSQKDNPLFIEIAEHSKRSYYEKIMLPIYQTWKGRLVFQTTGHFMVRRVLKKHKIRPLDILKINSKSGDIIQGDNPYFEDFNASIWFFS